MTKKLTSLEQLDLRLADARRLIEIHGELTGEERGRRHNYDALNRSAVMLSVAAWENFCEDLARRNAASLARRLKTSGDLPASIREPLIQWVYDTNGMSTLNGDTRRAMWALTGSGWRECYRVFAEAKTKSLNTPNSANIIELFRKTVGVSDITSTWGYRRWTRDVYVGKLDYLLRTRHMIAHGVINETVGKGQARASITLVNMLAQWMVTALATHFEAMDLQGRKARIRPA